MINDLKPYAEYKDSGLPWLGIIPIGWEVRRNGRLFSQRNETGYPELPILEVSLRTGVRVREFGSSNRKQVIAEKEKYKRACRGDIAYNMMRMWQGAVGVAPVDGLISPAYIVARPMTETEPRYFTKLYCTDAYKNVVNIFSRGIVSDRNRLYWEDFKQIPTPFPPPDEQASIVRFLDHANGKIERAIRAKRKLIALLNEQKQAIIRRAVTRGLDPAVKLKPSGIPWLGDVPEHWDVRRIKQVTSILRGKFTHRPRNDPSLYDGHYPFIQTGAVARASKFIRGYKQTLNDKGLAVSKMFPAGTLCMTIAANIGDVAILDFEACFPDSIVGLLPQKGTIRDYLFFVLRSMKQEFLLEAPVNTQGNLNVNRIGSMTIPLPPPNEQTSIVNQIESGSVALDQTIARASCEIDLLREYRTRLTADVVTGKVDVREAVKRLPAEPNETAEELDQEEVLDEIDAEEIEA